MAQTLTNEELTRYLGALGEAQNSKVDTNCRNIDYYGSKRFDGQWEILEKPIIPYSASLAANKHAVLSLSDILPNDEYEYECQFRIRSSRNDSSGTNNFVTLSSTKYDAPEDWLNGGVFGCETDGANFQQSQANGIIAIGEERSVRVSNFNVDTTVVVVLTSYRRLGTNE